MVSCSFESMHPPIANSVISAPHLGACRLMDFDQCMVAKNKKHHKPENNLEERLLDQAQAQASYTPFFQVVRIAYPNAWFSTSKKDPRKKFLILTPVPPTPTPVYPSRRVGGGGGGGGKTSLCIVAAECVFRRGS